MSRCKTCGGWDTPLFGGAHRCPPTWRVWCPEDGEEEADAETVHAYNAEAATLKWAEERDRNGENEISSGGRAEVLVRGAGDEPRLFTVTGEMVPEYSAREIKPKEGGR